MLREKSVGSEEGGNGGSLLRAAKNGDVERLLSLLDSENADINTANSSGLNCLHLAAKEGHVEVVKILIKHNIDINRATNRGNTALHIASLAGTLEIVQLLIENGADPNAIAQNAFTPLYMAAQEGHHHIVQYLLNQGANQSIATKDGFTPLAVALQEEKEQVVTLLLENDVKGRVKLPALHIAARKDDVKAAALLLQNDHSPEASSKWIVNRTTENGFTALHIAAHYGNVGVGSLLLNRGASHDFSAKNGITPLHVASKRGHTRFCSMLLDRGADLYAQTNDGLAPVHCAARSGNKPTVQLLISRMSLSDLPRTKNGLSALHMAAQGGHIDVVKILLNHAYPVDDLTSDYLTPLHITAHCGHERVAQLLLKWKAKIDAQALNGFTPLHVASKKNQVHIVTLLLRYGATKEAITESGLTPLHVACFMGHFEIVRILLEKGALLDAVNNRGETALHMATRCGKESLVKYLLDHGAHPDSRKKESQTCLHLAARLDKLDIAKILLQYGAAINEVTNDGYTALHIASKEGHIEICELLLEKGASVSQTTNKGFTSLHLASKYGRIEVVNLLLKNSASPDTPGKDGLTSLHVASHFDHQNVAVLLLKNGASPHASAKNAYTPLHIAAKKNQIEIAVTLLEYGASPSSKTKMGATPLHLSAQSGHTDMCSLLLARDANVNETAKFELTPMHLAAEEDKVSVAQVLYTGGSLVDPLSKMGYTPLHIASHHGSLKVAKYLLSIGCRVNAKTKNGYTALHLAAQQGHSQLVDLLLECGASPDELTNNGSTALSLAKRLGYITVVDTLTTVTTETTETTTDKHKILVPETIEEVFLSDVSDDDASPYGESSFIMGKELRELEDDSIEVTDASLIATARVLSPLEKTIESKRMSWYSSADESESGTGDFTTNGFLVSFIVDARGGSVRGSRHPNLRLIVPPKSCSAPVRITCRLVHGLTLPLHEDEGKAARIISLGSRRISFLKPVAIEIPHFASLRDGEREIVIVRSDDGESWKEHKQSCADVDFLNQAGGFGLEPIHVLVKKRVIRVIVKDLPRYFALYSRTREELLSVGPSGGVLESSAAKHASATFPQDALTKEIKVGIQVRSIPTELCKKLVGRKARVSPIVTVEPRRRKFHKPISLSIPYPDSDKMKDFFKTSSEESSIRLLCSISGGTDPARWEDITGSTPLVFHDGFVSFTTTVSAKFWLMNCLPNLDSTTLAERIYTTAVQVPYMAKFKVLGRAVRPNEVILRVVCLTDEKFDSDTDNQDNYVELARSRFVEILDSSPICAECSGNLIISEQSQPLCTFAPFKKNRMHFTVKVRDTVQEPNGCVTFYRYERGRTNYAHQKPLCRLNLSLQLDVKDGDSEEDQTEPPPYYQARDNYYLVDPSADFAASSDGAGSAYSTPKKTENGGHVERNSYSADSGDEAYLLRTDVTKPAKVNGGEPHIRYFDSASRSSHSDEHTDDGGKDNELKESSMVEKSENGADVSEVSATMITRTLFIKTTEADGIEVSGALIKVREEEGEATEVTRHIV